MKKLLIVGLVVLFRATLTLADTLPSEPKACVLLVEFTTSNLNLMTSSFSCDGEGVAALDRINPTSLDFAAERSGQVAKFIKLGLHVRSCDLQTQRNTSGTRSFYNHLDCLLTK